MRLRQTEGLVKSIFDLMGLAHFSVPDHTTLSRRAQIWTPSARRQLQSLPKGSLHVIVDSTGLKMFGTGQWLEERHGARSRRAWRKLHLAVDADSGEIIADCLTGQDDGDASQVAPLLDQIDGEIGQFTADGAYDGKPIYTAVLRHSPSARVVILIDPRLRARSFPAQQTEVAIGCAVLNRMLACGRPTSVHRGLAHAKRKHQRPTRRVFSIHASKPS